MSSANERTAFASTLAAEFHASNEAVAALPRMTAVATTGFSDLLDLAKNRNVAVFV